jgi:hypothetical protein
MKEDKPLLLMNGRWGGRNQQHVYVAAYSKADADRLLQQASGIPHSFMNEINVYFSKGCWGNAMDGITPERGVWVTDNWGDNRERLI